MVQQSGAHWTLPAVNHGDFWRDFQDASLCGFTPRGFIQSCFCCFHFVWLLRLEMLGRTSHLAAGNVISPLGASVSNLPYMRLYLLSSLAGRGIGAADGRAVPFGISLMVAFLCPALWFSLPCSCLPLTPFWRWFLAEMASTLSWAGLGSALYVGHYVTVSLSSLQVCVVFL